MILENSISAFLVCAGRHCLLIQLSRVITIVFRHMGTLDAKKSTTLQVAVLWTATNVFFRNFIIIYILKI